MVLPHGVASHHAERFVSEKRLWIERSLKRFSAIDHERCSETGGARPSAVRLDAAGLSLPVCYQATGSSNIRISEKGGELLLRGCTEDGEQVIRALQRWLKSKGRELLPQMLADLALKHGYSYEKVTVRLQKSRWGSCTRKGHISLNAKLLLLTPELCRYVMLHELAHLKHLNHSPLFWTTVERSDPDYREHMSQMRQVTGRLPKWVER